MTYRIAYRYRKHGRAPHVYDIYDETGRAIRCYSGTDPDAVKVEAQAWVREQEGGPPLTWLDKLDEPWRSQALRDLRKAGAA